MLQEQRTRQRKKRTATRSCRTRKCAFYFCSPGVVRRMQPRCGAAGAGARPRGPHGAPRFYAAAAAAAVAAAANAAVYRKFV